MKLFFITIAVLVLFAIGSFLVRLNRLTGYHDAVASISQCVADYGGGRGTFKAPLHQCQEDLRTKDYGGFKYDSATP